jgi:hypothetical protein
MQAAQKWSDVEIEVLKTISGIISSSWRGKCSRETLYSQ